MEIDPHGLERRMSSVEKRLVAIDRRLDGRGTRSEKRLDLVEH